MKTIDPTDGKKDPVIYLHPTVAEGEIEAGRTIDRYLVINVLYGGGAHHVYMAHDTSLERTVALKTLAPAARTDAEAAERLRHEAKALARAAGPHVLALHEVLEGAHGPVLVTEYLAGETLEQRLRLHGRLPLREALSLFDQAMDALERLHRTGMVHAALSPDNLFITTEGTLKVLDFGNACWTQTRVDFHARRSGNLLYCAPEQIEGRPIDVRTDVYALGMALHEALAGEMAGAPSFATNSEDVLPPALRGVILKAIEKDPDRRLQSMHEFRRALRAHMGRDAPAPAFAPPDVVDAPVARTPHARRSVWRRFRLDVMLFMVLLVLVLALGLYPNRPYPENNDAPALNRATVRGTLARDGSAPVAPQAAGAGTRGGGDQSTGAPPDKYQDLRQAWQ